MLQKISNLTVEAKPKTQAEPKAVEYDSLFEDAARLVVIDQNGSTSKIQRGLKLGYNRVGRIVDQLENAKILGPFIGAQNREVLIPGEWELEQLFLKLNIPTFKNSIKKEISYFDIVNPVQDKGTWHLVTNPALLSALSETNTLNLVHNLQQLNDDVSRELRIYGSKVVLVSANPEDDFDICDALLAHRFLVAVNTFGSEQVGYPAYLVNYYTGHKTKDEISENLLPLCEHISYIGNAFERDTLAKDMGRNFKIPKASIIKEINQFITIREKDLTQEVAEGEAALPAWIDKEHFWQFEFDSKVDNYHTGIYFSNSAKNVPKRLTNFTIKPLIHVYTKDEGSNRRLTEFDNGLPGGKVVMELPSKAFTSMDFFDALITQEGEFFTYDGFSKSHLNRLKAYYLQKYPKCYELKTLGWQPEGFFSFCNLIYKDVPVEYNDYGYADVDGTKFLSMGASNILAGVREEDNAYKNDKYLEFVQPKITLTEWAKLFILVYPDHGMMGVAFTMMSVFKDVLFKRNNNFPLLYPYGPKSSGKSKFAESIQSFFTLQMPMLNLNQTTVFAFFNRLERFRNVAVGLNEFDENSIEEVYFKALKGAFDGEGRDRGTGSKNKTKVQDINVAIMILGQYLTTSDDGSVLNRSFPCKFFENNARTH